MAEALRFFKIYEVWIYFLLGIGAVIYLRKFFVAWQDLRGAIFGLERESAQYRLNQAASVMVLLVIMAIAEFVVVSFVAPMVPGASPLPTPTLDLLATPTTTLTASLATAVGTQPLPAATPLPTLHLDASGCLPDQVMITSPEADEEISGEVQIQGTADIPDFGFYKLEVARREEPLLLTIQAGRQVVRNGVLVDNWDTTRWQPGSYVLQLVVVDSTGQPMPACRIPVRIGVP